MHIRQLSKKIGITTQELKKELSKVNFGIKPNDLEIPTSLVSGVLRIIGPKFKERKIRRLEQEGASKAEIDLVKNGKFYLGQSAEEEESKPKEEEKKEETKKEESFSSIEDKSKILEEKIKARQEEKEKSFKDKEKNKQTVDLSKVSIGNSIGNGRIKTERRAKRKSGGSLSITRKIELDPSETEKAKAETRAKKKIKFNELTEEEIKKMTEDERLQYFTELEESRKTEKESFKSGQKKKVKSMKTYDNQEQIKKKEGVIEIGEAINVKEFSEKVGVAIPAVISCLLKNGIPTTITQSIDYDTCALLALELDIKIKKEEIIISNSESGNILSQISDEKEDLKERPPVIAIMGHVDHGKTSILDFYRKSNVTEKESGGITQHIGAYQIEKNKKIITFLDTPGHEAFSEMRARGAKATDIAILVVAGNDGVKPQTKNAYNHIKESGVSLIVVLNKSDVDGYNPEKVKGELSELGVIPEDWGGDVPFVEISAKTGKGMDNLLETILLVAEVKELKANPDRLGIATIIESNLDKSLGPVATILLNTGTLKQKDIFITGSIIGKVKAITDSSNKKLKSLSPSGVAQICGFEKVPQIGDILQVVKTEKEAREVSEKIKLEESLKNKGSFGLQEIQARIQSGKMNLLKVILKTDANGSLEAISNSLSSIKNKEVGIKIIHGGVGAITESDVNMAAAAGGIVVGFHVGCPANSRNIAEKIGVDVKNYKIIYQLIDDMKLLLTGMLKIEEIEKEVGVMKIKGIFFTKKKMMIIGGIVSSGFVQKDAKISLFRDGEEVGTSFISNLKSFKDDVNEVKEGNECGLQLNPALDIKEGDEIKITVKEKIIKKLELEE